ncbi:MAG: SPASM domain-containing protein, partial [bacterium]|nr:SPASM domain-containing protein [bacterium]
CWIGAQAILLPPGIDEKCNIIPGNIGELKKLSRTLKKIGLDAFVVKPYSHQPSSVTKSYKEILYGNYSWLEKELKAIASDNFAVEYRSNAIQKYSEERPYNVCMAMPFASAHIMADGSVYSCSAHLLDRRFYLGNINKQSFREIWEGERRREQWETMKSFNLSDCRRNCRMDETNRYLWEVIHPPYNVNFI